jgi:hypothetical protein
MTTVVNIRTSRYDVYIGRGGQGKDGYFGNPFRVGELCSRCFNRHETRESTLDCYRAYLLKRVKNDPVFKERLEGLRGKVLGCFCRPFACHGDVIVDYLEGRLR